VEVDPRELQAHARNWRRHPDAQTRALDKTLDAVGWIQSVIVNERTGRMLDGHLRVARALERGEARVPVTYIDVDEEEEGLILASFDPIGAMAEEDEELLAQIIEEQDAIATEIVESLGFKFQESEVAASGPDTSPQLGAMTYSVVIEVVDEKQQAEMIERLSEEGFQCHPLIS